MAADGSLIFDARIGTQNFTEDTKNLKNTALAACSAIDQAMVVAATVDTSSISQDVNNLTNFIAQAIKQPKIEPKVDDDQFKDDMNDLQKQAGRASEDVGKEITEKLSSAVALGNIKFQIVQAISSAVSELPQQMVSIGAGFESSMSQVAATMGITDTAEEFGILTEAAKELGESTKYSAQQAGESLNYLALAGMNAEEAVSALPTVLNVAAAGGMELAAASDLITDAMSALGLELSDMNTFADQLAVTAQKSNTSVEQLGEAILTVGGTAKTLSGGVVEMNTALGILADNGIKGAEGGTALRNVILSLSAPTDKAAEALERLGINAFDEVGKMRPLQDTIADFNDALSDMSDQDRTAVLNEIFNKVDLKAVNALLGTSAERFHELSGYISDCEGAAAQMAETMDDNLNGDLTIMQSALEGLGIAAYKKFQEPMRTAVQSVTEDIGALTSSLTDGELSESFDKLSAGMSELVSGFSKLLAEDILPAAINGFAWIVDNGESIANTFAITAAAVVSYQIAVNGAAAATKLFTAEIMLDPLGLLVSALAAATVGMIEFMNAAEDYQQSLTAVDETTLAIQKQNEAFTVSVNAAHESMEAIDKNADVSARCWKEVQTLVDENGNATVSVSELETAVARLNEVSDSNIQVIDGQIQGYKELASTFDDYIEDIRTSAKLDALKPAYGEALLNYDKEALDNAWNDLVEKEAAYEQAMHDIDNMYNYDQKIVDAYTAAETEFSNASTYYAQLSESYTNAKAVIDEYEGILSDANSSAAGSYVDAMNEQNEAIGDYYRNLYGNAAAGAEETSSDLKDLWSALDHEYAMGIVADDTELYARRKELLEQYGDESNSEHWSYYEKLHDMEQEYNDKILAEREKADKEHAQEIAAAMDEQQDIVDNGLKDILKKYQDAYDEIEKKRQAYRDKLMSVGGDLFTVETDDNGNTSYIVNNIDEQLRKMREYDSAIRSLKEQNASDALIAELTSMSDEDSYQFAEYLSGMSASEFGRINELYNEKQKLADELSKDMYADEAQAVSDAMTEELAGLVTDSYDYGAMSAEQFALGFSEALNELKFGTVYNQLNAAGASRSYENYVIKDESGKERTIKLDIDISGKSNVYLDNQKVGEQVTDYQKKTAHIKGE